MDAAFSHVTDWVFDLDNCLYPASAGLFDLIDERMTAYIQRLEDCSPEEAKRVQKAHFHEHGTTLAGLMKTHDVDPHHFLADVHDIALDRVEANPRLARALSELPGRKFVFTNGDAPYASRVLERIGIRGQFAALHDVHASSLRPKPDPHGYTVLCESLGIDPRRALLVDDMIQNLRPAKVLGMTTVWVDNGSERGNHGFEHGVADHIIGDVADWLETILGTTE